MDKRLLIYTDGAARGNPGPSASGFVVYENKKRLNEYAEYNGIATNNYAEYRGILLALKWCASNLVPSETSIELYSDNELVIRQLNNEYKLKSKSLRPLNEEIRKLERDFKIVVFRNVRRSDKNISMVDRSLNLLLDEKMDTQ